MKGYTYVEFLAALKRRLFATYFSDIYTNIKTMSGHVHYIVDDATDDEADGIVTRLASDRRVFVLAGG